MGKKRGKPKQSKAAVGGNNSDDSDVDSVLSESEAPSIASLDDFGNATETYETADTLTTQISDALTLLESRTTSDRERSLKQIVGLLKGSYIPDLLEKWQLTLVTLLTKCLTKGKTIEADLASQALVLLFIQFGSGSMESHNETIRKSLEIGSRDTRHSMQLRGKFLLALAACSFFNFNREQDEGLLSELQVIFCGSMKKELVPYVTAALDGWCILATQSSTQRILDNFDKLLFRILKIFEEFQENRELRLAAGRVVALIYATINELDYRHRKFQKFDELYDLFNELSRQGAKIVSKKDRKAQKSSLRDALLFMDGDVFRTETVKFSEERLHIYSYSQLLLYESFKDVLGTGLNRHLTYNPHIRDLFSLGEVVASDISLLDKKQSKDRMREEFNEVDKARTLYLKKQRSKRSTARAFDDE